MHIGEPQPSEGPIRIYEECKNGVQTFIDISEYTCKAKDAEDCAHVLVSPSWLEEDDSNEEAFQEEELVRDGSPDKTCLPSRSDPDGWHVRRDARLKPCCCHK